MTRKKDDRDPYKHLWPKLMADPEIGIPGSWSMKYLGKEKGYKFTVSQYPGFNAKNAPITYTPEIYRQNLSRLFERIGNALINGRHAKGKTPPMG